VRAFSDKTRFDDCTFLELHINHKVSWGAPIPSTFQLLFPHLMRALAPPDTIVLLSVMDPADEGCLNPSKLVNDFIVPNNYLHFFIDKEWADTQISTLFFECPIDKLEILREIAYRGVVTEVEGFVFERSKVALVQTWKEMGNTDVMFRDLLRNIHFAFRLWQDYNGILICTDKFDERKLRDLLNAAGLEAWIADYIQEYDRHPEWQG